MNRKRQNLKALHDVRLYIWAVIFMLTGACAGCNWFGYIAHGVAGDKDAMKQYTVEYTGLEGKTFAVLVTTDSQTIHDAPSAPKAMSEAVSRKIVRYVENSTSTPYSKVEQFEATNRYWQISPYTQVYEKLDIERLVHIELLEFSTHEPGNEQIWQGTAAARVCIAEAENDDPNNFAYCQTVNAKFPPDRPVGLLDATHESIQRGLVIQLSSAIVNLFRDYEEADE